MQEFLTLNAVSASLTLFFVALGAVVAAGAAIWKFGEPFWTKWRESREAHRFEVIANQIRAERQARDFRTSTLSVLVPDAIPGFNRFVAYLRKNGWRVVVDEDGVAVRPPHWGDEHAHAPAPYGAS